MRNKNFRKRTRDEDPTPESEDEEERRLKLDEVKFLQKQRERKLGIPAVLAGKSGSNRLQGSGEKGDGDGEKEDLVLQDTFAQETAVTVEDPNMLKYVEQELAKRRGKSVDSGDKEEKDQVDELYVVPEHLKVKKRNSEESSTQWTTGIAEIQLPIEYKLRNIEETEAAKKLLQEKRLAGRAKSELTIPSSFSADYFQRGRDYAEKLRRDHPELYKDRDAEGNDIGAKATEVNNSDKAVRRQAATDELMLERFRKQRQATKEILLVHGEKSGRGVVQVYDDEVNNSVYGDHIEACCFLLRLERWNYESEVKEDSEGAIFSGKLHVGISNLGVFSEEANSCVVDRLAEGAWNCYFGKSSKWHYMGNLLKGSENHEI
ncbi:uncharacterized protein A4U43_C07F10400 [Asparagus officinalis]|uniref:Uncharacterized protein n=1 Tax=Asparagus officinalis TaxID=4686 RepID=A0A5P1EAU3_ASPOF|nr:uncharacterized protein A4U43_C07F10400 [Asparagus officinalis]